MIDAYWDDFIYWPNTCHPSLEKVADFVRSYLVDQSRHSVRIAKPRRPTYALRGEETESPLGGVVESLTIQTAYAPAPHVGRPFFYMWRVAVGEGNRWIAGPAWREYLPPDPTRPETW